MQENEKFKASLGNIARPSPKQKPTEIYDQRLERNEKANSANIYKSVPGQRAQGRSVHGVFMKQGGQ
jgi:hypothetical protein